MKKNLFKLSSYFFILIIWSFSQCKNENETYLKQPWNQISITLNGQIIDIYKQKGLPSFFRILVPKDSTQNFLLTNDEKDSVYNLVYEIIKNPVIPEYYINAHDAETVSFSINYKQVDITTDYHYIKSWRDLSDKTNILYSILSKKITFIKLSK